jgi:hypothetical protein
MPGIDSRREPKIFFSATPGDLLTRIHSDPHLVSQRETPRTTGHRKEREAIGFSLASARFRGGKSLEGRTCV